MTDPVVTAATMLSCPHGVPGQVSATAPKVTIEGSTVAVLGDMATVSGCPFTLPNGKPQPCVTARFMGPATRVMAGGLPVILQFSGDMFQSAEQVPNGPVTWTLPQLKVTAQ
jgi:uncharacterized Zn-binding protein involved in type VI secretion